MKKVEQQTRSVTNDVVTEQSCDLCGRKAVKPGVRWEGSSYDVSETEVTVTVSLKDGQSYPDCGMGTGYSIDICPYCFKEKLIPFLRSQGASVEATEWEW